MILHLQILSFLNNLPSDRLTRKVRPNLLFIFFVCKYASIHRYDMEINRKYVQINE